jgi:hypothetical protein
MPREFDTRHLLKRLLGLRVLTEVILASRSRPDDHLTDTGVSPAWPWPPRLSRSGRRPCRVIDAARARGVTVQGWAESLPALANPRTALPRRRKDVDLVTSDKQGAAAGPRARAAPVRGRGDVQRPAWIPPVTDAQTAPAFPKQPRLRGDRHRRRLLLPDKPVTHHESPAWLLGRRCDHAIRRGQERKSNG